MKAPGPDGAELTMKQVTTYIDEDSKKMVHFLVLEGTDIKMMEFNYTRKK